MIEITRKTKNAILVWAGMPESTHILLDDELSIFRPGALEDLRVELNIKFDGENGFPVDSYLWFEQKLEIVRDVRDFVLDRIEVEI